MGIFKRIAEFIQQLDEQETIRFIGICFGVVLLCMIFLLYRYYSIAHQLERRLKRVNQQRIEARSILAKHDLVLKQQRKVDELLKHDSNFKIKEFFATILQTLGIAQNLLKDPDTASQPLMEGYIEIKLESRLTGLSMYQLVELLQKIEQNERVYIKDITITKSKQNMLDILLIIATFETTTVLS